MRGYGISTVTVVPKLRQDRGWNHELHTVAVKVLRLACD